MRSRRKLLLLLVATVVCMQPSQFGGLYSKRTLLLGLPPGGSCGPTTTKAKVLAQPNGTNGELKHVEWDSWGWGGENTTVYLVFDPADALSQAALSHQSGKYNDIPCKADLVRRLESHWYTVRFFTNDLWRPGCSS